MFPGVLYYIIDYPSRNNPQFIAACKNLAGKPLTLENVNTLHGYCYDAGSKTGMSLCEQKDIDDYKKLVETNDIALFQIQAEKRFSTNSWICTVKLENSLMQTDLSYYTD